MSPDATRAHARVPRIKICGHTTEADVLASVAAGADAIGVIAVVSVDTPRQVTVDRAIELVESVPPLVSSVLVTMPESANDAIELVKTVRPDALQIHGTVSTDDLSVIADEIDCSLIRAVAAGDRGVAQEADSIADAILIDSTDGRGAGGTGITHNWNDARDLVGALESPVILAGGLTPTNIAEAITTVSPFGVDVASGVERAGGKKDHDAVRRFVVNTHRAIEVIV